MPQLLHLLEHHNWEVRFDVAEVLGNLLIAEHIPQLVELLDDHDARVRAAVVEALGKLGSIATTYIPQIAARQIADRLDRVVAA